MLGRDNIHKWRWCSAIRHLNGAQYVTLARFAEPETVLRMTHEHCVTLYGGIIMRFCQFWILYIIYNIKWVALFHSRNMDMSGSLGFNWSGACLGVLRDWFVWLMMALSGCILCFIGGFNLWSLWFCQFQLITL